MLLLFRKTLRRQTVAKKLLAVLVLINASGSAGAAEWSVKGTVDQFLGYDTNVRMQNNAQGSFFYKIIPVLTLSHKTDVSEVRASALYGTQVYTDFPGFNQDIQNYDLAGNYKTERFDWGLALNHSITPTRNTALQNSGNFAVNAASTTQSVSPTITYHLSEIDNLTLAPSYSVTTFSNGGSGVFRNYNNLNINLAWQRTWTERYTTALSFFYANLDSKQGSVADPTSFSFDSYGVNLTNNFALTERWKLAGTVGIRKTDSTNDQGNSSSIGFLADFGADYTLDNFTSGIHFSRSLTPSNFGRLQEQTDAGWNLSYKLAEKLTSSFSIYYLDTTQVNVANQNARQNIVIQPSVNWNFAPEWTLTGSYRYRTQDRTQDILGNTIDNKSVESHLIMLTLNYNWQGFNLSK